MHWPEWIVNGSEKGKVSTLLSRLIRLVQFINAERELNFMIKK